MSSWQPTFDELVKFSRSFMNVAQVRNNSALVGSKGKPLESHVFHFNYHLKSYHS